jgi:hypothetical protein
MISGQLTTWRNLHVEQNSSDGDQRNNLGKSKEIGASEFLTEDNLLRPRTTDTESLETSQVTGAMAESKAQNTLVLPQFRNFKKALDRIAHGKFLSSLLACCH